MTLPMTLSRAVVAVGCLIAVLALGAASAVAAASRATESIGSDVRKVVITQDNGSTRTIFERRDRLTCAWFEARLESQSSRYVYTPAGEAARRARTAQIQQFHRDADRFSYD